MSLAGEPGYRPTPCSAGVATVAGQFGMTFTPLAAEGGRATATIAAPRLTAVNGGKRRMSAFGIATCPTEQLPVEHCPLAPRANARGAHDATSANVTAPRPKSRTPHENRFRFIASPRREFRGAVFPSLARRVVADCGSAALDGGMSPAGRAKPSRPNNSIGRNGFAAGMRKRKTFRSKRLHRPGRPCRPCEAAGVPAAQYARR